MKTEQKDPILQTQIGSLKTVSERVRYLIGESSVNSKAKVWGVPTSTIAGMLERGTEPSIRNAVKIADAEGITLQWLATGIGPMRADHAKDSQEKNRQQAPTNSISIPMYEVEAAAGAGSWISEENVTDYWYFPQSWLRLERLEHADLCIINTIGDSMTPHINHGDRLLVKLNINREKALEGVFVINLDGNLRVKRLEFSLAPVGYRVMSDNEMYQEEFVPASEMHQRLYVIGEVVRVFGAPASQPASKGGNQHLTQESPLQVDKLTSRPEEGA